MFLLQGFILLLAASLSSIIISHFLLNLRKVTYAAQDGSFASRPSFIQSDNGNRTRSPISLRFATFLDNIGEPLEYGSDAVEPAREWDQQDRIPKGANRTVPGSEGPMSNSSTQGPPSPEGNMSENVAGSQIV